MLHGLPRKASPIDRASFIRHLALCAAALAAYAARAELRVGNSVLLVFGGAALLNLQVVLCAARPRFAPSMRILSPLLGLGGWSSLMFLTGGVRSPFVAGLSLEIVLAALATPPPGIALTTAGAVAGVLSQALVHGIGESALPIALETGFLIVLGGVTMYVTRQWRRSEERLSLRLAEERRRLQEFEKAVLEARMLGRVGERAARLAHGLKNTTHSLRGFTSLIQPRLAESQRDLEILDGIRLAIDRLEDLAHATLGSAGSAAADVHGMDGHELSRIVDEVVAETAVTFPGLRCTLSLGSELPTVRVAPASFREALTILVRNAAEAMEGIGEVLVEVTPGVGSLEIRVRDHGPGVPQEARGRMFEPGYTTKPRGHGFGLFLARRLLECHGGGIRINSGAGGGTICCIELPLHGTPLTA